MQQSDIIQILTDKRFNDAIYGIKRLQSRTEEDFLLDNLLEKRVALGSELSYPEQERMILEVEKECRKRGWNVFKVSSYSRKLRRSTVSAKDTKKIFRRIGEFVRGKRSYTDSKGNKKSERVIRCETLSPVWFKLDPIPEDTRTISYIENTPKKHVLLSCTSGQLNQGLTRGGLQWISQEKQERFERTILDSKKVSGL